MHVKLYKPIVRIKKRVFLIIHLPFINNHLHFPMSIAFKCLAFPDFTHLNNRALCQYFLFAVRVISLTHSHHFCRRHLVSCYFNYIHLNQFFYFSLHHSFPVIPLISSYVTHFQLCHSFPVMSLISGLPILHRFNTNREK
jgi:hypothetical protein